MRTKHLSVVAFFLLSCGINHQPPCGDGQVAASLSSVTLAQDCPGLPRGVSGDAAGACAEGFACPTLCRQTSMQLAFDSSSKSAATIVIVAVRLVDPATFRILETLKSREPEQWSVDQYVAWNEQVPAGASLKVTYKLSAPTYGDATTRLGNYQPYRVEVDLTVEGEPRTLHVDAQREPEVAT